MLANSPTPSNICVSGRSSSGDMPSSEVTSQCPSRSVSTISTEPENAPVKRTDAISQPGVFSRSCSASVANAPASHGSTNTKYAFSPTSMSAACSVSCRSVGVSSCDLAEDIAHNLRTEWFFYVQIHVELARFVTPQLRAVGRNDDAQDVFPAVAFGDLAEELHAVH